VLGNAEGDAEDDVLGEAVGTTEGDAFDGPTDIGGAGLLVLG
jgi:hypothetical protein